MRDSRRSFPARGRLASPFLVLAVLARAAGAAAHDREPINTEYAPPVEDLIFDWTASGFDRDDGTFFTLPAFVLEAPVVERMQIELALPVLRFDPDGGDGETNFGDLELGLRYQLFAERPGGRPDLDLNFELGIPTGDRDAELGGEAWEAALGLFVTKQARRSVWFGNVSYVAEIPREGEAERANLLAFATAVVASPHPRLHPTVELFGEWNGTEGETVAFVAPELIVTLGGGWEIKAAVPLGLTDESEDFGVQVQLTYALRLAQHEPHEP